MMVRKRRKGTLLLGLSALLPLVGFAGLAILAALEAYRDADEARLRHTARALGSAVDAEVGRYVSALEALATSSDLADPIDRTRFEDKARLVGERLGGWIVLIDSPPSYRMLANTRSQAGSALPSAVRDEGQDALLAPLARVFEGAAFGISDLFQGILSARPILAVVVPVDRPGQPRRALALGIEPASLRGLLARQELPGGSFAVIADGRHRVLAHSQDPEGRRLGNEAPSWVAASIRGARRAVVVGVGWNGAENVYAVDRSARTPDWTVSVAEPTASQEASAWRALRWLIAGGSALAIGLALVVWTSRREARHDALREAAALRAGRAEVERLHRGLPALIYLRTVEPDGTSRLLYRAGDIEAVLGWPPETFDQAETLEAWIEPGWPGVKTVMQRVLAEGNVETEFRFRQPDGSQRSLRTRFRLLSRRPDGGGEVVGYILDATAERDAKERAMSGARLASLGEMAAGVAHEIRQPLQSISLSAEIAALELRRGQNAEAEALLERIVAQTERTSEMIDGLRRFAIGAEDGQASEPVSLAAAVKGAVDLARSVLRDARISVEIDLGEPPPVVMGQTLLYEQVLSNLLLNAKDAMIQRPREAPRKVSIAARPGADNTVILTVADTGGGIPAKVLDRLFQPFVTTKAPAQGTGIGLSICHAIIISMGGRIEARNEGEGAVFKLTLPGASQPAQVPADQTQEIQS
jgi:C4-dicarboxylate-specific signal transduction histidine kinase